MKSLLTVLLLITFVAANAQKQENRIKVPNTRVSIVPPEGFKSADKFNGFTHEETGSSIMVLEIPGPVTEISKSFTAADLKAKGMTLISKKLVDWNNTKATLIHLSQVGNGTTYFKHILVIGDDKKTTLVNGIYPEIAKDIDEDMLTAVLSTKFN